MIMLLIRVSRGPCRESKVHRDIIGRPTGVLVVTENRLADLSRDGGTVQEAKPG
jgi:hypothetical protein